MHCELFSTLLGLSQIINNILCLGIVFCDNYMQLDSVVLTFKGPLFYHIYFSGGSLIQLPFAIIYFKLHFILKIHLLNTSFNLTFNKIYILSLSINKKVIFDYLKMTELPALRRNFSQVWLRRFRLSVSSLLWEGTCPEDRKRAWSQILRHHLFIFQSSKNCQLIELFDFQIHIFEIISYFNWHLGRIEQVIFSQYTSIDSKCNI